MTEALETVGAVLIWAAAVIAAIGVIAKAPLIRVPVRYLWFHLIAEPFGRWQDARTTAVIHREVPSIVDARLDARPLTNGWGAKAVQQIAAAVDADVEPPQSKEDHHP